jgi:hypothetical protein
MSAARFVARTQRRTRRGSVAVLALLVTVTATAVLTLTTAWRRADTVVDRWTRTAIPYDRFVIAQLGPDEMRALPGVARADRQEFIPLMATDQNVHVDGQAMEMSSLDSTTIVLDGRIPDGDNPFDVLVDEMAASQLHLGVGDTIDVRFFAPDQNDAIVGGDYSHPHGDRHRGGHHPSVAGGHCRPLAHPAKRLASTAPDDHLPDLAAGRSSR